MKIKTTNTTHKNKQKTFWTNETNFFLLQKVEIDGKNADLAAD